MGWLSRGISLSVDTYLLATYMETWPWASLQWSISRFLVYAELTSFAFFQMQFRKHYSRQQQQQGTSSCHHLGCSGGYHLLQTDVTESAALGKKSVPQGPNRRGEKIRWVTGWVTESCFTSRWGRGLQTDNTAGAVAGILKGKVWLPDCQFPCLVNRWTKVSVLLLYDVSSPFITLTNT